VQPGIAQVTELTVRALRQDFGGRARQRVVQAVELRQQRHIDGGVLARKTGPAAPIQEPQRLRIAILGDQARQVLS
jgi:hypothetical protein